MVVEDERENFEAFLDCLSSSVIARLTPAAKKGPKKRNAKGRKNEIKPVVDQNLEADGQDTGELSDFIEVS